MLGRKPTDRDIRCLSLPYGKVGVRGESPAADELGNYLEVVPGFSSSRLRKAGSITPTSASIESGMCAIRPSGSRPTAREGRFLSGRRAALLRGGSRLPLAHDDSEVHPRWPGVLAVTVESTGERSGVATFAETAGRRPDRSEVGLGQRGCSPA